MNTFVAYLVAPNRTLNGSTSTTSSALALIDFTHRYPQSLIDSILIVIEGEGLEFWIIMFLRLSRFSWAATSSGTSTTTGLSLLFLGSINSDYYLSWSTFVFSPIIIMTIISKYYKNYLQF